MPPTELKIVCESGEIAAAGEDGEIWMRTGVKPRWYFRDDEATASAWHDGWLKTGDIGHLDADGFLYLVCMLCGDAVPCSLGEAPAKVKLQRPPAQDCEPPWI